MGVTAGDYDNDGDVDLFMTHLDRETNTLYLNDGTGMFEDVSIRAAIGMPRWEYTGCGTRWIDYDLATMRFVWIFKLQERQFPRL